MAGLPGRVLRRLRGTPSAPLAVRVPAALLEVAREGALPLAPRDPGSSLDVAIVVTSFRRGSGGHSTLAHLMRGLEERGHRCSVWVEDDEGRHVGEDVDASFKDFFGPLRGPVRLGFDGWGGADVVVATGWQTVHRTLRLPGIGARAYIVQDHEPEFYGTSAESVWAAETYGLGLHCICASPWLARLVADRYGASASAFDLGVDHGTYKPTGGTRRDDLVLLYARAVTARRAVPLGVLAMEELKRRRSGVEIALFGESRPIETRFPHTNLGVLPGPELAAAYGRATVGVVLSMTNPSLVPTEMLACGLPTVDLAADSMVETFGVDGPIALAPFDPVGLADVVERLLDDSAERSRRASAGLELVAERSWTRAAEQVESGLLAAVGR